MEVQGRNIVVTGGASGIGRALARRFAAEGARGVVVADLDEGGAKSVAQEFGGLGMGVDVTDEAQIQELVASAEREYGPIDLFCSNAGIGTAGGVEVSDAAWNQIWDVNLMSHVYAARAVLPGMIERGEGYLLNTASAAGLLSQIGSAPYAVTKHAAVALAEWLAITHGDQGIRVSVLCPQAVRTAMTAATEGGGVAGVDGMMEPEELADHVIEGLADERFLILPHPTVLEYMQRKTGDYDRWLSGMRRLNARFGGKVG
jgi:NAD(P)-dependent dehydrogenase (short-subunit alcohol dehydrogenase family)